jgi:TrmH family RNA methyltransferase
MISKSRKRFIISLQKKKIRDIERLFVIEGDKLVKEFLNAKIPVKTLIAKPEFLKELQAELSSTVSEIEVVSHEELKQISTLKTPHNALAVVPIPESYPDPDEIFKGLSVALDSIQDPGNLGTIIRAAAWFGIKNIVCSEDSVDLYNPKVVQSSMGAILHVNVYKLDMKNFLILANKKRIPVFGTMLAGKSIYDHKLDNKCVILLGNESKGISDILIPHINEKIMIPGFINVKYGIDSLNIGMAASIVFSEFRRRAAY